MLQRSKLKSDFSRNVLTLMAGTTVAQAIPFAISPILTRIYTPEDFGLFALYMAVASIVASIATGRYEMAVILPKKDKDAVNIVILSILISFIVSAISLIVVFIFNSNITSLLGSPDISNWLYFIPVTVLLTGIYQSFNYWSNRKKKYKRLSINKVVQSGGSSTANLGMGFSGVGGGGLILGQTFGQLISTICLAGLVWKEDKEKIDYFDKARVVKLAFKYIKFPKYNLPNALVDGVRYSGINILIANFFSVAILGQFSLAWKIIQMPIGIIGSSLSQVFYQQISIANRSDIHKILYGYLIKASLISAPIFFLIYFFSVDVFRFVFGESWELAGQAASVMTPWLFLNFLSLPIANFFIVLNRQEVVFIVSIIYMIIPISILIIFNSMSFIEVLKIITISMSVILAAYILLALNFTIKENDEN